MNYVVWTIDMESVFEQRETEVFRILGVRLKHANFDRRIRFRYLLGLSKFSADCDLTVVEKFK